MKMIYLNFSLLLMLSIMMTIQSYNLIYSVFWLVMSFILSSFIIYLNNLMEIALFILMIYGGAMSIMFVFSIMMVNLNKYGIYNFYKVDSILLFIFMMTILFFILYTMFSFNNECILVWSEMINYKNFLKNISMSFYLNNYFLMMSSAILLLIPMINVLILIKCLLFLFLFHF